MPRPAVIVLEDGAVFRGEALAGQGSAGGELVFNTGMTGHQELATDPSACGQIVAFTFPMIGNYGADPEREESGRPHARGILARELTNYRFNRSSRATWLDWLSERGVLAVTGVDTSAVARHLRVGGPQRAVVSTEMADTRHLRRAAQALPKAENLDLARIVTCGEAYEAPAPPGAPAPDMRIVAYDFGIRRSTLAQLGRCGFRVTVVPARTSAREVLKRDPDGVLLSSGPGDPAAVTYGVKAAQRLLGKVPVFGIGLGHQVLGLALGLSTYRLPVGHRGAGRPVVDARTGAVEITVQNHGFAVRGSGAGINVTHVDLEDGVVEGIAAPDRFASSVQFRPEAAPGPRDSRHLLERFRDEIARFRAEVR